MSVAPESSLCCQCLIMTELDGYTLHVITQQHQPLVYIKRKIRFNNSSWLHFLS